MKNYNAVLITSFALFATNFFCTLRSAAQAPPILVQRCYGGDSTDVINCINHTSDGGYIATGATRSVNGDLAANGGIKGLWVLKLDNGLNIQWQRTYSEASSGSYVEQTRDGGYILTGSSTIKLRNDGSIEWGTRGGIKVHQTTDDGFILCGGGEDFIKLHPDGVTEWVKSYYSSGFTIPDFHVYDALPSLSGEYVLAGRSMYEPGDIFASVVRADNLGNWVVPVTIVNRNGIIHQIVKTRDGAYAAVGEVGYRHPARMVARFDNNCNVAWDDNVSYEHATSVAATLDNSCVVAGANGSKLELARYDINGTELWSEGIGGTLSSSANFVLQDDNGNYVVAGQTDATDGDVHGNHGGTDGWIVILGTNVGVGTVSATNNNMEVYPIPASQNLNVKLPEGYEQATLRLTDMLGRATPVKAEVTARERVLDLSNVPAGTYVLEAIGTNGVICKKVVHY